MSYICYRIGGKSLAELHERMQMFLDDNPNAQIINFSAYFDGDKHCALVITKEHVERESRQISKRVPFVRNRETSRVRRDEFKNDVANGLERRDISQINAHVREPNTTSNGFWRRKHYREEDIANNRERNFKKDSWANDRNIGKSRIVLKKRQGIFEKNSNTSSSKNREVDRYSIFSNPSRRSFFERKNNERKQRDDENDEYEDLHASYKRR